MISAYPNPYWKANHSSSGVRVYYLTPRGKSTAFSTVWFMIEAILNAERNLNKNKGCQVIYFCRKFWKGGQSPAWDDPGTRSNINFGMNYGLEYPNGNTWRIVDEHVKESDIKPELAKWLKGGAL